MKRILLLFITLLCTADIFAQQNIADKKKANNNEELQTEDDDSDEADSTAIKYVVDRKIKFFPSGYVGQNTNKRNSGSNSIKQNGLNWALSANLCRDFAFSDSAQRLLFTAGLQVTNYNATYSYIDYLEETAYNNFHYWYGGVPLSFIYTNNNLSKIGLFAQAGITPYYKIFVSNIKGEEGTKTSVKVNDNFKSIMVTGDLSAGVIINVMKNPLLVGLYGNSNLFNMSSVAGLKENILSFGVKLSWLPSVKFKK